MSLLEWLLEELGNWDCMTSNEKNIQDIVDSVGIIYEAKNDKEMNKKYIDIYTTLEQQNRDIKVTELLGLYVEQYKYKNKSNKWYKGILFICSNGILITFTVVFIKLIFSFDIGNAENEIGYGQIAEVISVCITFLTLIVSILKIIAKYGFPENEDAYVTQIVQLIQENDLKNKKENIKVVRTELGKESKKEA